MSDDEDYPDLGFGQEEDNPLHPSEKLFLRGLPQKSDHIDQTSPTECYFVASPTIVHFGGFEVGAAQTQTVSVINSSSTSRRFQILLPTSDNFKVSKIITHSKFQLLSLNYAPED